LEDNDELLELRNRINRDLGAVERLYADLHWQAVASYKDREMPGGRAMNMLGPAANRERWDEQYFAAEMQVWEDDSRSWPEFVDYFDDQVDSDQHPLFVLDSWAQVVREERDQPTSLKATVSRCVDYLHGSVDWMLHTNEWNELEWFAVHEFARELRSLVTSMENVLSAGRRSDRIRTMCMYCDEAPRLVRRWTESEDRDHWYCPGCGHGYDIDGVIRARHQRLLSEGADRWVAIDIARDVADVDRRTWWSWRSRLQVRAACEIQTKRMVVWWPSVRELVKAREDRLAKRRGA
jgi:hypothetical protein